MQHSVGAPLHCHGQFSFSLNNFWASLVQAKLETCPGGRTQKFKSFKAHLRNDDRVNKDEAKNIEKSVFLNDAFKYESN